MKLPNSYDIFNFMEYNTQSRIFSHERQSQYPSEILVTLVQEGNSTLSRFCLAVKSAWENSHCNGPTFVGPTHRAPKLIGEHVLKALPQSLPAALFHPSTLLPPWRVQLYLSYAWPRLKRPTKADALF